mmetsp:Transcript_29301/g.68965  ORF Transcript_29301/g.68965 Transcript_29301/m.68965 type:complete len:302 (-) Transcript_29301:781-1686(-)
MSLVVRAVSVERHICLEAMDDSVRRMGSTEESAERERPQPVVCAVRVILAWPSKPTHAPHWTLAVMLALTSTSTVTSTFREVVSPIGSCPRRAPRPLGSGRPRNRRTTPCSAVVSSMVRLHGMVRFAGTTSRQLPSSSSTTTASSEMSSNNACLSSSRCCPDTLAIIFAAPAATVHLAAGDTVTVVSPPAWPMACATASDTPQRAPTPTTTTLCFASRPRWRVATATALTTMAAISLCGASHAASASLFDTVCGADGSSSGATSTPAPRMSSVCAAACRPAHPFRHSEGKIASRMALAPAP